MSCPFFSLGTNWRLFISVPKEAYLATVSVTAILLLISLGLLGHLIVFHFYLSKFQLFCACLFICPWRSKSQLIKFSTNLRIFNDENICIKFIDHMKFYDQFPDFICIYKQE